MAPKKQPLGCLANRVLVERLQNDLDMYMEAKKDHLVMTFRKAIHSLKECSRPIRCKSDAKELKGIGDFVASRIETILFKEKLLNVEPGRNIHNISLIAQEELVGEQSIQEMKKSDVSSYVPRQGGLSFIILISSLMVSCETDCASIELRELEKKIREVDSSITYSSRKMKEALRLLEKRGLLILQDEELCLTPVGEKLGAMCLEDCRLDYPTVRTFIEEGLLKRVDTITKPVVDSSQGCEPQPQLPTSLSLGTPSFDISTLQWPLPSPPPNTLMGAPYEKEVFDVDPMPSFTPVTVTPIKSDWEVILILDNREIRTHQDRSFLENQLREVGVNCERRTLGLGDMQWILHHVSTGQEVMLNVIVERKNTRDLAWSIMDGRFNEQQFRLLHCGCDHPIYLVEGNVRSQDLLPAEALLTAMATTVVSRGIFVYQSTSIDDSVDFLKELNSIILEWVNDYFDSSNERCFQTQRMSFDDFQNIYQKKRTVKIRNLWYSQLRQIPKCSASKALVIIKRFPTLASLLNAYSQLSSTKEKEDLLKNLCDSKMQNMIGPALSKKIFHLLCDI